MDKISGELELAELQKETLFKAYEQLQSQASSVLLFALQWKDLEERFDGIRTLLERRAEELHEGERSLAERSREVALREEGLRSAWQRVKECEEEVRRKMVDLRSVEMRLEECRDVHRKKESELVMKRDALTECNSLIRDKEKELRSLMQATEECRRDYDSKKEVLRCELDLKEKKVGSVQSLLEENARELDAKAKNLGSVKRFLDECSRAVEIKRGELSVVHSQLEESEKRLRVMERAIKEYDEEVARKAGELQSLEDKIKDCRVELKAKQDVLCLVGSLGSIQHWQIKTEEPQDLAVHNADDSSVVNPPLPTVSARNDPQLLRTELLNENDLICKEISHKLQNLSDPAQLVLDVFAGSYAQYSSSKDMDSETDISRSQIVMLEQLVRISPSITHEVEEGAMKLAREWKARISDKPASGLEVLAFQHFLAAYNLVSLLNDSEILKLAEVVTQNDDPPPSDRTLGLVNEITAHQLAYLLLSPESIDSCPD